MESLFALLVGAFVLWVLIFVSWRGSKIYHDLNPGAQRDFPIGFFGIIILNVILYPLFLAIKGDSALQETRATVALALPWVVNLALLIFFAFYRRWIALGALALVGSLLAWVVLSGMFFYISCFVLILGGGALTSIVSFFAHFFGVM
jgi:hypothetical protein